jgi:hypothetical protein
MISLLKEVREGYYFLLVKLRGHSEAKSQLKFGFKVLFFGYYVSAVSVIIVLLTYNHPVSIPKNIFTYLIGVPLLLYPYYRISLYLLREVEGDEIDEYQSNGLIKSKILKCVAVFFGSFLSLLIPAYLSMALMGRL